MLYIVTLGQVLEIYSVTIGVSGKVVVHYYATHEGHDSSIAHLRLHKDQRLEAVA